MSHKLNLILASAALLMAGCSTPPAVETADAKPDVRQGAELTQLCFSQQVRDWRQAKNVEHKSVIVSKNRKEEYKLDLLGACRPEDAFLSIGLVSRVGGGSCLSVGDKLVTDVRYSNDECLIQKIHEWHEEAAKPAAAG